MKHSADRTHHRGALLGRAEEAGAIELGLEVVEKLK
jgi:hypothetical protein